MLFKILVIVYFFIFFIAIFGETSKKELQQDIKDWKRIIGDNYE